MWLSVKDHFMFGMVPWSVRGGAVAHGSSA